MTWSAVSGVVDQLDVSLSEIAASNPRLPTAGRIGLLRRLTFGIELSTMTTGALGSWRLPSPESRALPKPNISDQTSL